MEDLNLSLDTRTQSALNSVKIDRLTSLAPELLTQIYKDLHCSNCHAAPCKALLHYHRSVKFRNVYIGKLKTLRLLGKALSSNPHLGSYCITLAFWGFDNELDTQSAFHDYTKILIHFLNVEQITIRGISLACYWGLRYIHGPGQHKPNFPKLIELVLACDLPAGGEESLHLFSLLEEIKAYPSLKSVHLELYPEHRGGTNIVPPHGQSTPQTFRSAQLISNITHLSLSDNATSLNTRTLIMALPNLTHFHYNPTNPSGDHLIAVLEVCPCTLISLSLTCEADEDYDSIDVTSSIDKYLPRFSDLEALELAVFQFSRDVFRHLEDPLPLKVLSIGKQGKEAVFMEDLVNLITPGSRFHNSSLKRILLDLVKGEVGETTGQEEFWNCGESTEDKPELYDWSPPEWLEDQFDSQDLKALINLGKEVGVQIAGSAVDALKVQDAYDVEVARWREMQADPQKYYDEADREAKEWDAQQQALLIRTGTCTYFSFQ